MTHRKSTDAPASARLPEAELEERFVRSGKPGGQRSNKTATAVVLRHRPTGIVVRCEAYRSQAANRLMARRLLADRLQAQDRARRVAEGQEAARRRAQRRRRSPSGQARMLESKKRRGRLKAGRGTRGIDLGS